MKTRKHFIAMALFAIIALVFACIACKNEPETPQTITKTVTVTFPAFTVATSVDFTASYSPSIAGGGFVNSDVTYTVYCAELNRTYSGTELTANISDGYSDGVYTFTQTFKASNGTTINSRIIKILIDFDYFTELQDTSGTPLVTQAIPSITLTLTKTITEILP